MLKPVVLFSIKMILNYLCSKDKLAKVIKVLKILLGWGCHSLVKHLPSMHETLSSNPNTTRRKKKKLSLNQLALLINLSKLFIQTVFIKGFSYKINYISPNKVRSLTDSRFLGRREVAAVAEAETQ